MLNGSPIELVSLADEMREVAEELERSAVQRPHIRMVFGICQRLVSTADYMRTVADMPPMLHGVAMDSPFFLPENMEAEDAGTPSSPR